MDCPLCFSTPVSSLEAKFFVLDALRCIYSSSWSVFLYKVLFVPFSLTLLHPDGFLFVELESCNAFTEWRVVQSTATCPPPYFSETSLLPPPTTSHSNSFHPFTLRQSKSVLSLLKLLPCSCYNFSSLLSLILCNELFVLFPLFIRLQWVPGHSFLPDNDTVD